jgi:hypothetical protein
MGENPKTEVLRSCQSEVPGSGLQGSGSFTHGGKAGQIGKHGTVLVATGA